MCKILNIGIAVISLFLVTKLKAQMTIVEQHGALRTQGNKIVGKHGNPVQLRGMSLYWSQWQGQFYNESAVRWLRDDWKCTVVRAAMAVEAGGYLTNPQQEKDKVIAVVEAAIKLGIYVIIDWHDHNAQDHLQEAQNFFSEMAERFGDYPNVIYELFNEPVLNQDENGWRDVIKPYHEAVIPRIREHDSDNLIVCGTRSWSQEVEEASENPLIQFSNIAYTLHYYAGTHAQYLRDKAQAALDNNVALFVTEWGTSEATGNGHFATDESRLWWSFLDDNKISWANWSLTTVDETSGALEEGASAEGGWSNNDISPSGEFVRAELIDKYEEPVKIQSANARGLVPMQMFYYGGTPVSIEGESNDVAIFDVLGKRLSTLSFQNGRLHWGGQSDQRQYVPPGNYFLNFKSQPEK